MELLLNITLGKEKANQIPETASRPMQWQGYIYIHLPYRVVE